MKDVNLTQPPEPKETISGPKGRPQKASKENEVLIELVNAKQAKSVLNYLTGWCLIGSHGSLAVAVVPYSSTHVFKISSGYACTTDKRGLLKFASFQLPLSSLCCDWSHEPSDSAFWLWSSCGCRSRGAHSQKNS
jgi:hypothetical protein